MAKRPKRPGVHAPAKPPAAKHWFAFPNSRDCLILGSILAVGLLVRIIYLLDFQSSFYYGIHLLDAAAIDQTAQRIAAGQLTFPEPFFRAPLYLYFAGLIYSIFGTAPLPIILVQHLLGLATALLVYYYARRLFGSTVALTAAAITVVWPTLIFFETELMTTTLEVFLGFLSLILMHRAIEERTTRSLIIAGLVLGLAAITRATFLLMAAIPMTFLLVTGGGAALRRMKLAISFLAAMAIPIIPVTLHNVISAGDFVLIASQGGANFYIGNAPSADGITVSQLVGNSGDPLAQDNVASIRAAEAETGTRLSASQASSYWMRRALSGIIANPVRAIGLFARKLFLFWHGQEIFNNKSPYFARDYSNLMSLLLWRAGVNFPSGILFPLAFAGIFVAVRRRLSWRIPTVFVISYSVTIALFFVNSRFRQPVIPIAVIFAAFAACSVMAAIRGNERRTAVGAGAIFVAGLLILNLGNDVESTANRSQAAASRGFYAFSAGDFATAITWLEHAREIDPANLGIYPQLGAAYNTIGDLAKAEATLNEAIRLYPNHYAAHFNLALINVRRGNLDPAREHFSIANRLDPSRIEPYIALGDVLQQFGLADSVRKLYQAAARLDPNHPLVIQRLSQAPKL